MTQDEQINALLARIAALEARVAVLEAERFHYWQPIPRDATPTPRSPWEMPDPPYRVTWGGFGLPKAVIGAWPGDETDEEVRRALDELS